MRVWTSAGGRAMRWSVLVGCLVFAAPAFADKGFPDWVMLPAKLVPAPDQKIVAEAVGVASFVVDGAGTTQEVEGRHWSGWLAYRPAAGEPAPGYYNGTEARIFEAVNGAFAKAGWTLVVASDGKDQMTFHLAAAGREAWAAVRADGPQAQVFVEVVEIAAAKNALVLKPPAEVPETFGPGDDIPYLPPWPGAKRVDQGASDGPLDVAEPGRDPEAKLVGSSVVVRTYQGPANLSQIQFVGDFRAALIAAGWTVLFPASAEAVRDQGSLAAHYAKGRRDVWVRLFYQYGAALTYQVADVGAEDWAPKLAKECRIPLYGVFFDFDKATLKPESDSVLRKAADLLVAQPAQKAEIQGHTDNVGGDDYNLKLSDARAASVRVWMTQHGIAAARLTSKGYGRSRPVADNATDVGRARNRRVELVLGGCKP